MLVTDLYQIFGTYALFGDVAATLVSATLLKKRAVKENYLANVPMWLLQGSCVLLVLLSWRCLVPLKREGGAQSDTESEDTNNQ